MKIINPIMKTFRQHLVLIILFQVSILSSTFSQEEFQPALLTSSVTPAIVSPGQALKCRFEFINNGQQSTQSPERIFIHFETEKDCRTIQWQADHIPSISTQYWMTDQTIVDGPYQFTVPEDTPEGEYFVHIGIWNPESGTRSLDTYHPHKITVSNDAPPFTYEKPESIDLDEIKRRQFHLLRRFDKGTLVTIENSKILFQLQTEKGIFKLINKINEQTWQSLPNKPLGYIYAQHKDGQYACIPLNNMDLLTFNQSNAQLVKSYRDQQLMLLNVKVVDNKPLLSFDWSPPENIEELEWQITEVRFPSLLWTTESMGGGAVIPRLEGQLFEPDSGIPFINTFKLFDGWNGLNVPIAGINRRLGSAAMMFDHTEISVACRSDIIDDPAIPGQQVLSLELQAPYPAKQFQIQLDTKNSYVGIAQMARTHAKDREHFVTLKEKLKGNRELKKLFGAPEFKPFVCVRHRRIDENGNVKESVSNAYTEMDCIAILNHLQKELEIDKALFVLAGWIHRGYDNQHPDILPAAPEIGGDKGVKRIAEEAKSAGYLFGLHDNYQDMYEDAPSWDPTAIMMRKNGERMKGGMWAGGQAWLIASNRGYQFAQRNLPEVEKRYDPNAYFIDTTFAAPLYESHDPENPLTRADDLHYKQKLFELAADHFEVVGSETGMEFGVPVSHYFEGILSGNPMISSFPNQGAMPIPFFPLAFHDCVVMFTHQGDRCGPGDARQILEHLVTGTMPLYRIGPHRYWEREAPNYDLSKPEFCFARSNAGWGEGKHPMDCFIKNTYSFLSPFTEKVATLPMTNHRYVKKDRSVERSQFGEHWTVIVNYGPENHLEDKTLLPPMGFIITGPDFLAQHYYPDARNKKSMLLVKNGKETYIGFR